jgi:hypothetical protein
MVVTLSEREKELSVSALRRRYKLVDSIYSSFAQQQSARSAIEEALLRVGEEGLINIKGELAIQFRKSVYWARQTELGYDRSNKTKRVREEQAALLAHLCRGDERESVVRVVATLTPLERSFLFSFLTKVIRRRRGKPTWFSSFGDPEEWLRQAMLLEVLTYQLHEANRIEIVEDQIKLVREMLWTAAHIPRNIINDHLPFSSPDPSERNRKQLLCLAAHKRLRLIKDTESILDLASEGIFSTYEVFSFFLL